MSLCSGCHAGCCRSFAVPVTGADIIRIERNLGLDFWQFICRWEDSEGQIAGRYAPHFYFADEPQTPFVICLIQQESQLFPGSTKCQFLQETPPNATSPLGTGSCGIYSSRPAACRVFPTRFRENEDLVVIHDVPSHGRPMNSNPLYQLCPRQWTTSDIDPIQTVEDLVVAKFEMSLFHNIAMQWNQRPQEWQVFPDFLRLVYDARVSEERQTHSETEAPRRFAA